ncbi:unnamed protein product [Diatraea saccharalis]|uniref:Uncharacterized protein n=1 Tax=Diatraea saccharalis TaxID=40085 RepID=A0A9N9WEE9_9NEOP|nr:unnamed protein product [Diatraea saccharalis]
MYDTKTGCICSCIFASTKKKRKRAIREIIFLLSAWIFYCVFVMSSSDLENLDLTPSDITEDAQRANEAIFPDKSRDKYLEKYEKFMKWRSEKNCISFSENVSLAYFNELSLK